MDGIGNECERQRREEESWQSDVLERLRTSKQSLEPVPEARRMEEETSENEERNGAEISATATDGAIVNDTTTNAAAASNHADNQTFDIRQAVGGGMHAVSDLINEHIIAARYATFATVVLLGAVGMSRTPLFHRFKSVSEIPAEFFAERRTLHGRVIHVVQEGSGGTTAASMSKTEASMAEKPVVCLIRHLSPVGRLLSKTAFDFSLSNSPSVRLGGRIEESRDLLKVEIAGIKSPPFYRIAGGYEQPGEWLNRLAANRTPVACTLMARRVDKSLVREGTGSRSRASNERASKTATSDSFDAEDHHLQSRAICQVRYRPRMFSIFRQDLATSLVASGRATVLSSGVHADDPSMTIIDGDNDLKTLQADATYLENLASSEFEAVKERRGMWNDQLVRQQHPELVEEAEEQTASRGMKVWRWIRERAGF